MKHYQDLFVTCKCFTIVPCLGARKLWRPKACGAFARAMRSMQRFVSPTACCSDRRWPPTRPT
eukprot:scaffold42158_cov44-Phaeocystis_antarctica.AAC.1